MRGGKKLYIHSTLTSQVYSTAIGAFVSLGIGFSSGTPFRSVKRELSFLQKAQKFPFDYSIGMLNGRLCWSFVLVYIVCFQLFKKGNPNPLFDFLTFDPQQMVNTCTCIYRLWLKQVLHSFIWFMSISSY